MRVAGWLGREIIQGLGFRAQGRGFKGPSLTGIEEPQPQALGRRAALRPICSRHEVLGFRGV